MNGCLGGCLGRVLALVLLAVAVVAAWRFGPELAERFPELTERIPEVRTGSTTEVSPEAADEALERYSTLRSGGSTEVTFSAIELESLLLYRLADHVPAGISDPSIRIGDGEVRARLDVALRLLPALPDLEGLRDVLPDPVPVEFRGLVVTLEGGHAAFLVRRIDAAGVPVPRRFHADIAEAVDPLRDEELPPEAISLPLPEGVGELRVLGDELLVRSPA